jgi:hypothetical protein
MDSQYLCAPLRSGSMTRRSLRAMLTASPLPLVVCDWMEAMVRATECECMRLGLRGAYITHKSQLVASLSILDGALCRVGGGPPTFWIFFTTLESCGQLQNDSIQIQVLQYMYSCTLPNNLNKDHE